ncbi:MAG: tetratricopeptide repeat protein, partial [Gemmatimonadota bacterium]|nr:tetratricopeptide repeat protein [Gemmatimonadota bacterium]
MRVAVRRLLLSVAASAALVSGAQARQAGSELQGAFQLERRGNFEEASRSYKALLSSNPVNLSALNGLERVLKPLGQLDSLLPFVDAALARQPANHSVHSLKLRTLAELNLVMELNEAGEAWVERTPDAVDPYATWAEQLLALGDESGAKDVLQQGVERVGGGGDALYSLLGEVSILREEWLDAATYWRFALLRNPSLFSDAVRNLEHAPEHMWSRVVDEITRENDDVTGRVASDLWLSWSSPERAWVWLDMSLPSDQQASLSILRRFADRAGRLDTREGYRARGFALEVLANRSNGPAIRRTRLESAEAFAKAGEPESADRMLQLAGVTRESQQGGGEAVAALIGVMIESGRLEEAEQQYGEWRDRMPANDRDDLREKLVRQWIVRGNLDRADSLLEQDSTVTVLALRGRIALYRGDIASAGELLMRAGPRTGNRLQATERASMLAMLQPISVERSPLLGEAMLLLQSGDSVRALPRLEQAAASLPADGGRVTVLVLAGRVALSLDRFDDAERILSEAVSSDASSPSAPSAGYHLALAFAGRGLNGRAVTQL